MTSKNPKKLSDNPAIVIVGAIAAIATIIASCIVLFVFAGLVKHHREKQ